MCVMVLFILRFKIEIHTLSRAARDSFSPRLRASVRGEESTDANRFCQTKDPLKHSDWQVQCKPRSLPLSLLHLHPPPPPPHLCWKRRGREFILLLMRHTQALSHRGGWWTRDDPCGALAAPTPQFDPPATTDSHMLQIRAHNSPWTHLVCRVIVSRHSACTQKMFPYGQWGGRGPVTTDDLSCQSHN